MGNSRDHQRGNQLTANGEDLVAAGSTLSLTMWLANPATLTPLAPIGVATTARTPGDRYWAACSWLLRVGRFRLRQRPLCWCMSGCLAPNRNMASLSDMNALRSRSAKRESNSSPVTIAIRSHSGSQTYRKPPQQVDRLPTTGQEPAVVKANRLMYERPIRQADTNRLGQRSHQ